MTELNHTTNTNSDPTPPLVADTPPPDTGPETEPGDHPRIYVASLADYVNGRLHGVWIDATQDATVVWQQIRDMLAASPTARDHGAPAEEVAIHDYEGFGPVRLGEYENVATVTRLARLIATHGPAYAAWADDIGLDYATADDADRNFDASYAGHYDSREDFVQEFLDDIGLHATLDHAVPGPLGAYVTFDTEGFARDLELGGDLTVLDDPEGGCFIFRN